MGDLIEFKRNKVFSLRDAQQLLPIIQKITADAVEQVTRLEQGVRELPPETEERADLENQLNDIVQQWSNKVIKLGAIPKGFWLVDFDNGEGYFCWKYGEDEVKFFHEYSTDFTSRTRIN